MWIGQWNSTYKNSLQWEAERKPMKKDWEIYLFRPIGTQCVMGYSRYGQKQDANSNA